MQQEHSIRRQALLAIFVVSGFTGLIYESIWSHYLKLFLGHAAYAQTLVLAIFMGGMALGAWLVGRYSTRIRQLLLGYVVVEGVIGIFGLVFHRLFVGSMDLSFETVIPALSSDAAVHAFKWTLAALLILPQSTLLGTTFPLISGGIIRRWPERPGEVLSMLYFTNSLGAALGVLASGFFLIRAVGLPGTILTAALINIALALTVWAIVKHHPEPPSLPAPPVAANRGESHRWFLIAAFATGCASFLYEIGWIRMLSLVLGSSTHSFELMLSAFIFGLAFGGLWMRKRIDRVQDPGRYLGIVMVVMGGLALLTLPAYNLTFDFMAFAMRAFRQTEGGYFAFNVVGQLIAVLIMVPTTFCAGMTLPLLTRALMRRGGERAIGSIYAANTFGAIVGVLLAVHLVMPLIGVKGVILSGAVVHIALGASALFLVASVRPLTRFALPGACAALAVVAILGVRLDPLRLTSAVYRSGEARQTDANVLYLRDGKTATISLVERDGVISIATNGKPDAAIQMGAGPAASDEITMVFAAALPLSMHPAPRRVANIGFGSGLTSHAVLAGEHVESLDSIEIEPFMVEAARQAYWPRIRSVFEDPRSRVIYEDAKTFFATVREPYDVIISEPSNPWVSGVATLFSDEFYSRIVRYLAPDGLLVQWLQIYETDITIIASIVKAMSPHFGAYAVYNTDDSNILIVATPGTSLPSPSAAVFRQPALRAELEHVGIRSVADIEQRRIGDRRTLDPLVRSYPVPANSDFFPFVDLNAPQYRFMQRSAVELTGLLTIPVPVAEMLQGWTIPPDRSQPADASALYRDAMTRRSLDVKAALENGRFDDVPAGIVRILLLVETPREKCTDPGARAAWRSAVRDVSDFTTPFLGAEDLEPVWRHILASPCRRTSPDAHTAWVDFLAAMARREAERMAILGPSMLADATVVRTTDERAYLLTATATALIAIGRVAEAHALLQQHWHKAANAPVYALSLRQLLALTRAETREGRVAEATSPDMTRLVTN